MSFKEFKELETLPAGHYKVFAAYDATNPDISSEWTFRIYSSEDIEIKPVEEDPVFMREIFSSASKKDGNAKSIGGNYPDIKFGAEYSGGAYFLTIYIENGSKDMIYKRTTTINKQDGVILPGELKSGSHTVTLKPGEHYAYPIYYITGRGTPTLNYSSDHSLEYA